MVKGSPLKTLSTGLLSLVLKKEATEQEYEALGRMTQQCAVIQKRSQYSLELERAITEAELTTRLLTMVENGICIEDREFEPEDIVIYYNGVFLEFIHTIKDKHLRLVWWMLQNENSPSKEPQKIGLSNFKSYKETLENIGIFSLLYEWDQNSSNSGIAVCLSKRTHHHHFISNLRYNKDFQKIQLSKTMLAPKSISSLSEYGKSEMKKLGEKAYKKWRTEITAKQIDTLELVKKNINSIALKLIDYYKVPVDKDEQVKIMNKYIEVQQNFKIENKTSTKKIPVDFKKDIKTLISRIRQSPNCDLISVYLVGSLPRGEFMSGCSDINLIILTDHNKYTGYTNDINPLFNIKFFSKKEFISKQMKKFRFICKYDGVLFDGEPIEINNEKFPKPGLLLALLLNKGFIEELESIKKYITELHNPNKDILRFNSLKAVRIMLDFNFGAAITNKPYYTGSRAERMQYIKEIFPKLLRQTLVFEDIYYSGIIRQQDFQMVIDTFLENAKRNYKKMIKVEEEIVNSKKI